MARKYGIGGSGKPNKKYFQHNYIDVIQSITPELYHDTDYSIYGNEEDILYSVLGKVLKAADGISSILNVSNADTSTLQQHFIRRNNLTNIKPAFFEHKILKPLGSTFDNFSTRAEFRSYLSSVILPHIHTDHPTAVFRQGVQEIDPTVSSMALTRDYLRDNLSWCYFLNSSGPAGGFDSSTGTAETLSYLFEGNTIEEKDGVKLLFEILWKNKEVSSHFATYIPPIFAKANSLVASDTHASGTQQLEGLQTLLEVWYNSSDDQSTTIDDYLDEYLLFGTFSTKQIAGGAFTKFLQAVSFGFYDINTTIQDLEDLVDIERCPPQFLQYLGSLIGWQLLTGDVDRWRAQLRKAVFLYKSKGTRRCLEDAISLVFPGTDIDIVDNLTETWESFLPRMIYYLIATESTVLNSKSYTIGSLPGIAADQFFVNNEDLNYRAATDYVLKTLHDHAPVSHTSPSGGSIYINQKKFELATWDPSNPDFNGFFHRGKANVKVPPWENDRFYDNTFITDSQILILNKLLTAPALPASGVDGSGGGLGIPVEYVGALSSILMKEGLVESVYNLNWNKKWKFYTSALSVPPNLSSIIANGDSRKLSLLDYWSSKSSYVFSNLSLNKLNHDIEGINMGTDEVLDTVKVIFKTFAPFHVVIKLFADAEVTDISPSVGDSMCLNITLENLDMTQAGDTDQVILTNLIPSSVEVSSTGDITWYPNSSRTTGRRRNFKYNTRHNYYNRGGKAMPIPIVYVSTSGEPSEVSALNVHSTEFIPLGYNFSAGRYYSPSGSFSGIYDTSNDVAMNNMALEFLGDPVGAPGTEYYIPRRSRMGNKDVIYNYGGVSVSSTFPCRAPMDTSCSISINRNDISYLNQMIIRKLIAQGKTEDFGEETLKYFEFGPVVNLDFFDSGGLFANSTMIRDNPRDSIPYSESDIKLIYSYFNSLVMGKQSRVHTRTSDIYSTSGGTRGQYIDFMGGVTSASGGIADSASPYGSGLKYELSDD